MSTTDFERWVTCDKCGRLKVEWRKCTCEELKMKVNKDAETGKFVSNQELKDNPEGTYQQTVETRSNWLNAIIETARRLEEAKTRLAVAQSKIIISPEEKTLEIEALRLELELIRLTMNVPEVEL